MPNTKAGSKPHISRGNIFDDLDLSPHEALEAKVKADIWRDLMNHIERKKFSQADLVQTLRIHQPDVSNLLKGKISKFSTDKLIKLAGRLNLGVHVQLTERKAPRRIVSNVSAARAAKKVLTHA
jgi:predicted XRE-type DNA-binding protein